MLSSLFSLQSGFHVLTLCQWVCDMCVFSCVCVSISCVCVCVGVCMSMCLFTCVCVSLWVRVCVCV